MNSLKSTIGSVIMIIIAIAGINYKESILSVMGVFELLIILISIIVLGFIWIYHRINTAGKELKEKLYSLKKISDRKIKDLDSSIDNNWKVGHIRLEKALSMITKQDVKIKEGPIEENPELELARKLRNDVQLEIEKLETYFDKWDHIKVNIKD